MLVHLRDGSAQASVMCCHTETEAADQTFYITQSQYTDTRPTNPSTDPITSGAWQGSHGVPILKSLIWLDPEKSCRKRDLNSGSCTLEADALTTWPTRWWKNGEAPAVDLDLMKQVHLLPWKRNSGFLFPIVFLLCFFFFFFFSLLLFFVSILSTLPTHSPTCFSVALFSQYHQKKLDNDYL